MTNAESHIIIDLARQHLWLYDGAATVFETPVSTAVNGPGELTGSECTPRGLHYIRARIGAGCPPNTVFRGRRPTGEIYSAELGARYPDRDWILTRILWLCGREPGRNRLGPVDTMRRYIYLHGTPDETPLGVAGSHGCIRVANDAMIRLFDLVRVGTTVDIRDKNRTED